MRLVLNASPAGEINVGKLRKDQETVRRVRETGRRGDQT
jgi:hypothetical protein